MRLLAVTWAGFGVLALQLLDVLEPTVYGLAIPAAAIGWGARQRDIWARALSRVGLAASAGRHPR